MSNEVVRLVSYDMTPTDTGITTTFVIELTVNERIVAFSASDFIPDNKICGSSTYLVDSYTRVRDVIIGLADSIKRAA